MVKKVRIRPHWLQNDTVSDIYSVSGCMSPNLEDYVRHWKHNGYWLFDSPEVIEGLAAVRRMELGVATLFYYEVYETEYDHDAGVWRPFAPEHSLRTDVVEPDDRKLEGFDIVSFSGGTCAECSPLSCNNMASTIKVNRHCLIDTLEAAKSYLENGAFRQCEPGPYRLFAVYTLGRSLFAGEPAGTEKGDGRTPCA